MAFYNGNNVLRQINEFCVCVCVCVCVCIKLRLYITLNQIYYNNIRSYKTDQLQLFF